MPKSILLKLIKLLYTAIAFHPEPSIPLVSGPPSPSPPGASLDDHEAAEDDEEDEEDEGEQHPRNDADLLRQRVVHRQHQLLHAQLEAGGRLVQHRATVVVNLRKSGSV